MKNVNGFIKYLTYPYTNANFECQSSIHVTYTVKEIAIICYLKEAPCVMILIHRYNICGSWYRYFHLLINIINSSSSLTTIVAFNENDLFIHL